MIEYELSETMLKILEVLREHGRLTRPEMVKITGIPRTTIYDTISRLIRLGYDIRKIQVPTGHRGRPRVYYELVEG